MELNNFELFVSLLCSCLVGVFLSTWNMTSLMTHRELSFIIALFIILNITIAAQSTTRRALVAYLNTNTAAITSKQLNDLQSAHRKHTSILKSENSAQTHRLQHELRRAYAKIDRLESEYEWMTDTYQEQMRISQEQEDRIDYLEVKLQEFGQATPLLQPPFSAPATQVGFGKSLRQVALDAERTSLTAMALDQIEEEI